MQKEQNKVALVWFRNDLRVKDQSSLAKAMEKANKVIAVYCLDPRHFKVSSYGFIKTNVFRTKFLLETLHQLKSNLNKINVSLLVFREKPEKIIPKLHGIYGFTEVYFQKEWTTEEIKVEEALKERLNEAAQMISVYDQFLVHPDDIIMGLDHIPDIFTEFRKNIEKYSKVRPVVELPKKMPEANLLEVENVIPTLVEMGFTEPDFVSISAFPFQGGEQNAMNRLDYYFFRSGKLGKYKETRNNLIGRDYSSKLSAWLSNGSVSPRTIYWAVRKFEKRYILNQSTSWLIYELIWRDYFKYVSMKYGSKMFSSHGIKSKLKKWKKDKDLVRQWVEGETSEPFVNANMIELKRTGWMSNRGRQNVASYFTKTLGLDWRIGASYFESMLVDYDVHSNYGNWMYVAGVGNDPRNRTFNIPLQALRYDPEQKFQKIWLEEILYE
ncbi:DASH family cryptochrome [Namhaeicola litoreus]|uniref:Cryptochrome DASH n=1 Tax=Namhaeicola litoreus TaxID=1052145 RepID=A0ABW3Y6S3_9FLAO